MKPHTILNFLGAIGLAAVTVSSLDAAPMGSAFTYQGRLNFSGAPAADGLYDFKFTLHDAATLGAPVGAAVDVNAVPVTNGLFTAQLDFGAPAFTTGEARWLHLQVNTNGVTPLASLNPRQRLSPTPQAIYAGNAATASAVAPGAVTSAGIAVDAVDGDVIADGSIGAADLAPSLLNGTFWKLGGNSGPGNFLGSVDNQPVELRANNQLALRLLPNATSPNLIGGHSANSVNPAAHGAFIGGGGFAGAGNRVESHYATVAGGLRNIASGEAAFVGGGSSNYAIWPHTVIGGGDSNRAQGFYAVIGGGYHNFTGEQGATVGGGQQNQALGHHSTIGGGSGNTADGFGSVVGGGGRNQASVLYATVGGGGNNEALGTNSVVAGGRSNRASGLASSVVGGESNRIAEDSSHATIAGGYSNTITVDTAAASIGGGRFNSAQSWDSVISGGSENTIGSGSHESTISGGIRNTIEASSSSTVSGGGENTIGSGSHNSTIGGGVYNTIEAISADSTVAGGSFHYIGSNAISSTISGGGGNRIGTNSSYAAIGGGSENESARNARYATIPGGRDNFATNYAFAAGRRAKAIHDGSLVWADDTNADFASTTNKQFAVRANNGVMIQSSATALDLRGGGGVRVEGAGVNSPTPIFTHRATAANTSGSETRISNQHCNGKPGAILIVTYNFNPAGLAGTRNDRPVGIYYTGTQWAIYNLDAAVMPVGAAYNVFVANP